jgi:hypothetical protein
MGGMIQTRNRPPPAEYLPSGVMKVFCFGRVFFCRDLFWFGVDQVSVFGVQDGAVGLGFNFGRFSSNSFDYRLDSGSPQAPPGMTVLVGRRCNQNRCRIIQDGSARKNPLNFVGSGAAQMPTTETRTPNAEHRVTERHPCPLS